MPAHRPQEHRVGATAGSDTLRLCEGLERGLRISTRVSDNRGHRAIDKTQKRLRGLSKYTRTPTRERLVDRLIERQVFVEEEIDKLAQMVFWTRDPLKHELQQIWAQIEQWIFVRRLAKVIRHHTFSAS